MSVGIVVLALASVGAAFAILVGLKAHALLHHDDASIDPSLPDPPVSILKPLHGAEPNLAENLAAFASQSYAQRPQILLGVQDRGDRAIPIADEVRRRFAAADIALVIDESVHGSNAKVSNIINIAKYARHPILVLSDSDMWVPADYLARVTAVFADRRVGAATCLYAGRAAGAGFWPQVAAMGISYQFLPNVLLGIALDMAEPCFGSTIALRKEVLDEIGGFAAVADVLADDYELGALVRAKGYRVAIPPMIVSHVSAEHSLSELVSHELRWARTIRLMDPLGHWGSIVTYPFPLALIASLVPGLGFYGLAAALLALAARLFLKTRLDRIVGHRTGSVFLVPLRDILSFVVFAGSLFGSKVRWRGADFRIQTGGAMTRTP